MLLSKPAYYADFVAFPLLLLPLGAALAYGGTAYSTLRWFIACAVGLLAWGLVEYALHRFVLHRVAPFRRMHDCHHANPTAMVGTPTWLSALLIGIGVFLPAWWQAGLHVASGLTFGLVTGYLWYVLLHHAVHRWPARWSTYLRRAQQRHGLHHRARDACNFGVTSACWDRVFGTAHS